MKNFIIFALVAVAVWVGWMKVWTDFIPVNIAKNFVDEQRVTIDSSDYGGNFKYTDPKGVEHFTKPPRGIDPDFRVKKVYGPKPWDPGDSHVLVFDVTFGPSPLAPAGLNRQLNYVLVLESTGSYMLPEWKTTIFVPEGTYDNIKKREARQSK